MLGAPPGPRQQAARGGKGPLVASAFALIASAWACPAYAQGGAAPGYPPCTTQADEAATQAAQGAFQAGNASFNEADYPRAIVYWEDAYRRDCTAHLMLKNLARAYELNGQFEHAIVALQTFIDRNPESPEREALQRRIENLQQKLDEQKRAAAAVPPPEETQKTPPPKPEPAPKRSVLDEQEQFPAEDDEPASGRSVVPLVFAGVGVAAGVVGGALWYVAKKDADDAEEACGGGRQNCPKSISDKGNAAVTSQVRWTIVAGAGAALAVGGLIWYFAQPEAQESASLTPELGPGFAGLSYQGAF